MKKFIAAVMSFILVIATCAFAACTPEEENLGVVNGNYVETDAKGLSTALANVNADLTDIAGGAGFDFATKFAVSFNMPETLSLSADGNFGYKINADMSGETPVLTGAGSGSVSYSLRKDKTNVEESYSANIYNDSQYLYLNTTAADNGKIDYLKLINDAMQGQLPGIGEGEGDSEIGGGMDLPATGMPDISELISQMEKLGIKAYIDTDNGLKIKLSLDAVTFKSLLIVAAQSVKDFLPAEVATTITAMLALVEFSDFNIDFYLVFDADGKFVQYGEDININASVELPAAVGVSGPITLQFSNSAYLKAYTGTVTLPDGLDAYPDITDKIGLPAVGV
ncbi:MAG: hypothetical protein K2K80_00400 [Clostridia bacterium]|nr:hypothetical protein [Clostridia bacterium]